MSRHVASLVYQKRVGSIARKSILAYCADRANDDGSGVWASKARIAKEVECSKQTVIDTMRTFVSDGVMIECGKKKTPHGYVVIYAINIAAVKALPDAFDDQFSVDETTSPILDGSNELTPRGQMSLPQEVKSVDPNRPLTVLKPRTPIPPKGDDLFSEESEPEKRDQTSVDFERFWKEYPKKAGKPAARKAFEKAIKRAPAEIIIVRAKRYAAWLTDGDGFKPHPKHPQGWLNDDRWDDAELRDADPNKPRNKYQEIAERHRGLA